MTNIPAGARDPIEEFKQEVEALRVSGSGVSTIIGWTLYLLVAIDALLNACGVRSPSMLIAGAVMEVRSTVEPRVTGFALLVSFLQLLLLGIAGISLFGSPWRRWLPRRLRETTPIELFMGTTKLTRRDDILALLLFVFTLVILFFQSLIPLWSLGFMALLVGLVVVILVDYCMTNLILAVALAARRDAASAAGLLIGCIVPLVTALYADPPSVVLHTLPSGVAEFGAFQLGVLAIAVGGMWLTQLGSISKTERIILNLDLGPTGVLTELPDAVSGVYRPFQFRVRAHSKKVILLSLPDNDARYYRVHSTVDWHDLTNARWLLLNLDELEKSIGTDGKITLVRHGQTGYFECSIDLYLHTVSPEVYLGRLRDHDVTIAIDEFYGLHGLLHGAEVANKLRQDLVTAIGNGLDNAIDLESGTGTYSIKSLQSLRGSMRARVSELRQELDMQVEAFRTYALASLRVNREEEIRAYVIDIFKKVTPLIEQVRQEYEKMTRLDQGMSIIRDNLQNKLRVAVEQTLRRVTNVSVQTDASDAADIRLRDLITLSVQPVTINLTPEAQQFHQEIDALYKELDTHVNQATQEMGVIAKEYGNIVRQQVKDMGLRSQVMGTMIGPSPQSTVNSSIQWSTIGTPPGTQSDPGHRIEQSRPGEEPEDSESPPATDSPFPD